MLIAVCSTYRSACAAVMALVVWAVAAGAQSPARPARAETIHGRVTADSSGMPLPGADVIVTMVPSTETVHTTTGDSGEYSITIADGTGEYVVYIGALGRTPFRKRITRTAQQTDYALDARLAKAVTAVAAIKVQVSRVRPTRSFGTTSGTGTNGTDKTVDGVAAALPPELAGNLGALGSLVPGIASTPDGLSAFGLGADQNQRSLNGLSFGGGDLPRDARTSTRFQLSPWDPSVGGFAGASMAVTLLPGENVARRNGHVALDHRALQSADAIARRTGEQLSRVDASAGGSGPLVLDEYFYNYGLQVSRSTSPVASLADLDPLVLARSGLARDSAARILDLLAARGLGAPGRIPAGRTSTSATFMERIDHSPSATITGRPPRRTWSLTGYGHWAKSTGTALTATNAPDYGVQTTNASAAVQGTSSTYFGRDGQFLNETTTGLTVTSAGVTPSSRTPAGGISVVSSMPDGSAEVSTAWFGANPQFASNLSTWTWETVNQTNWLAGGHSSLPLHLYLQSRYTGFTNSVDANRAGSFDFASIEDFTNNSPSAYSRTLMAPNRSGGEWTGAAALGGSWTRGRIVLTGGARADGSRFLSTPAFNPALERDFGLRNDRAPADLGLSPRLGFTWYYTGDKPSTLGTVSGSQVSLARGGSQIRGGIGEFRASLPATLISDAVGSTGLSGATREIRCIGAAVPIPAWQDYERDASTIPDRCADGTVARADSAPYVAFFDRSFTPTRTWKSTLGWTTWNDFFYLALDGTYAVNQHVASAVDVNFRGEEQFALASEGNRPVFTPASDIVSATGATTVGASRRFSEFGTVVDRRADLTSTARQLTAYALPELPIQWGTLSLSYTYIDARAQARGFDRAAGGDPGSIEWSRSPVPVHQLVVQAYHYFIKPDVGVTASLRAASGLPYTPLVLGDVNGDGVSNDRAFVYDPASAPDTALANGMHRLLGGSSAARACLGAQLGRIAERGSCVAPWSATMNAGIFFGRELPGFRRARVALNLVNVPAGLDQLLHGSNVHGWGATAIPDPVLLRVRGFDATHQRFLYDVNGGFGASAQSARAFRAPFRLTLDVAIDLGRSVAAQRLQQNLRIRPGLVGTRAPVDTIMKRYMDGFQDVYAALLRISDSLALSSDQIRAIETRRTYLRHRADSVYTSLTTYLVSLPATYDEEAAVARVNATTEAAWQLIYDEAPFLRSLLTAGQLRRLPGGLRSLATIPGWRGRFMLRG